MDRNKYDDGGGVGMNHLRPWRMIMNSTLHEIQGIEKYWIRYQSVRV
jgi:hypothetical protein